MEFYLNLPIYGMSSNIIKTDKYLYLFSGFDGYSYTSMVYNSRINNDKYTNLNNWTLVSPLPKVLTEQQTLILGNKIYTIGGYYHENSTNYIPNIYVATIDSDNGNLTKWKTYNLLPYPLAKAAIATKGNTVYLFGGYNYDKVYDSILINKFTGNKLGSWNISKVKLPIPMYSAKAFTIDNEIYLLAGNTDEEELLDIYKIYTNEEEDIDRIELYSKLPIHITHTDIAIVNDKLAIFGGYDIFNSSDSSDKIYTTSIVGDNKLIKWNCSNYVLPKPLTEHSVIVVNDLIYVIGGHTNQNYNKKIFVIPANEI